LESQVMAIMPAHAKRFWQMVGTVLAVGRCMQNGSGGRAVRKTVLAVGSAVMAVESAVMAVERAIMAVRFLRHYRTFEASVLAVGSAIMAVERAIMAVRFLRHYRTFEASVLAVGSAIMAVERAIMAVRNGSGGVPLGLGYVGVGSGGWKCHYGGWTKNEQCVHTRKINTKRKN
jgi:hypothetical protein